VKNVGEPCAGEPHARFEVAAGGNQTSRASTRRAVQAPLADLQSADRVSHGEHEQWGRDRSAAMIDLWHAGYAYRVAVAHLGIAPWG